jgi:hypothetical protein
MVLLFIPTARVLQHEAEPLHDVPCVGVEDADSEVFAKPRSTTASGWDAD